MFEEIKESFISCVGKIIGEKLASLVLRVSFIIICIIVPVFGSLNTKSLNFSKEINIDEDKDNINKFENPKPTQTVEEARELFLNDFISEKDLLEVNKYNINWMAFGKISEEEFSNLENMIEKLKYYLKYNHGYSDEKIKYYFESAKIEISEDGEQTFFVLNSGENISISELKNLYIGIKDAINIINKYSKDIFGIKINEEPILYGNNDIIEEQIKKIREDYDNDEISNAKFRAYSLSRIILENKDMQFYQKYISHNKDLFIESLGVVYIDNKQYVLNSEVLNDSYRPIINIILKSQYSDGTTVIDSIKDKINEYNKEYDIKYQINPKDENSKVYIVKLLGYGREKEEPDYLGVYEYNSVANHIETIYQLGYGTINERLKDMYMKS